MNLEEIVNRKEAITQDECIFVIKEYLKERKGVNINPVCRHAHDVILMARMATYAVHWFMVR